MIKPALPHIDKIRLSALHSLDILDTEPEESFDRITRLCRRIFNVPIAAVSLVDEHRQWFKSCQGLTVTETSRDISFCGHAILDEDIMVVEDAQQDPRFHDNPLVTGAPFIRFYAGYPIHEACGNKLGTLCIIDRHPRELSEEDREILRDMAAMVESEIETIQIAQTDELTRISNSRGFKTLAPHYLNFCKRERLPATLAFIDLNEFKLINDCHGHAAGDDVLVALADLMKNTFRQTDLPARLGGDEFVVLFPNTNRKHANNTLANFQTILNEYNRHHGRGFDISMSYGVVQFDGSRHDNIDDLLKEGDELMYKAKKQRKLMSMIRI